MRARIMKRIFQAYGLALFFSNVAVASDEMIQKSSYRFLGDEKAINICAAALKSGSSLVAEAKKLHITRKSLRDVTCNGETLSDFVTANKSNLGSKALASAQ